MDCIFCAIANGRIPANSVYEDGQVMVIEDIHPKAPVHLLVIPRQHIGSLKEVDQPHEALVGHMLAVLSKVAADKKLAGYKTVINTGKEGGQVIGHLHFHLLGGKTFAE